MSNSALATVHVPAYSGNYTKGRSGKKISEITIHHMAGRLTAERCGQLFQAVGRNGSTHYGVGYDGIIGQYVDEADTAWANSNWDANCRAVTIETANDSSGGNWPVNDVTLNSLIRLVADIAKRNGLVPLVKGKNLTWHQMYAATACPGPYLLGKIDYIVAEANKILTGGSAGTTTVTPVDVTYQAYTTKWLGNINQHNTADANNGYAGIFGQPIKGVYANPSIGNLTYKVHILGGGWLPEVINRNDFAGASALNKPIDAIMVKSDSTIAHCQVHYQGGQWLSDVTGYNEADSNNGYAGIFGKAIDGLMIWCDPIIHVEAAPEPEPEPIPAEQPQLYRIRISWEDAKSQIGAYANLNSAISMCPVGYKVFDKDGNVVYENNVILEPDPEPAPPAEEIPTPPVIEEPVEEELEYSIPGDVNGDGMINEADIELLKEYLSAYDYNTGKSDIKIYSGADVNGDGVINSFDLMELKKMVAQADIPSDEPVDIAPEIPEGEGAKEDGPGDDAPAASFWTKLIQLVLNFFKNLFKKK